MPKNRKPLSTTHPQLIGEWDWQRNVDFTPDDVHAGSHKSASWICPPQCAQYGFKPADPSLVYFLKNQELKARKVGITNITRGNDRVGAYFSTGWKLLAQWEMVGSEARAVETEAFMWIRKELVLPQFLSHREIGRAGGATETFSMEGPSDEEVKLKIQAIVENRSARA